MTIIDIVIFLLFALFAIAGYHKGFLKSILYIAAFFISMLCAWWLHPQLAQTLKASGKVLPIIMNYSESADMLGDIENVRAIATNISPEALNDIIAQSNLPHPLGPLLAQNVASAAFAQDGLTTLGQYLGMIIANMTVNILCFVFIFAVLYIIFIILINMYDYVFKFKVLKLFDSIAGTLLGFLQGFLLLFVLFSLLPIVLAFLNFDEILVMIQNSNLGNFYYHSNFIIDMIKGIIS
jgi:uncharacterized membrane protein required for colicin V production